MGWDWIAPLSIIASIASIIGLTITLYQIRQDNKKKGKYALVLSSANGKTWQLKFVCTALAVSLFFAIGSLMLQPDYQDTMPITITPDNIETKIPILSDNNKTEEYVRFGSDEPRDMRRVPIASGSSGTKHSSRRPDDESVVMEVQVTPPESNIIGSAVTVNFESIVVNNSTNQNKTKIVESEAHSEREK